MQFNDFVATGFNQLVNNAAKIRYRWGGSVPMVVRMPWGGLRHAGPYHSQNTEPWFYRTPCLKIVVPSTPHDARAAMATAVADPDPVLYYEHIALYRDPRVKQALGDAPAALPLGRAALRRAGADLAIVSYGAYVHVALRIADRLAADSIDPDVALANVHTVIPLGAPFPMSGDGFDVIHGVAVDLFCDCVGGKVGPFFLNPGTPGLSPSRLTLAILLAWPNPPVIVPGVASRSPISARRFFAVASGPAPARRKLA